MRLILSVLCFAAGMRVAATAADDSNSVGMIMVKVKGGRFSYGSASLGDTNYPKRQVSIETDFLIGSTEVTQRQWEAVMKTSPWNGNKRVRVSPKNPAVVISWYDAVRFCNRLSKREGYPLCYSISDPPTGLKYDKEPIVKLIKDATGYRLPSEVEWEFACRAGTLSRYYFGDDIRKLKDHGWVGDHQFAANVASKPPNQWGLHDMHGNVHEWCQDWFEPPRTGTPGQRTYRGGCWYSGWFYCRSCSRFGASPSFRHCIIGFRVVRVEGKTSRKRSKNRTGTHSKSIKNKD